MNRTAQVLAAINRITRQYFRDRSNLLDTVFIESKQLGGVYIKFLQQLTSSEYATTRLSSLTDNLDAYDKVATEHIDIERTLAAEFGSRINEFTVLHGGVPIAAGSVSSPNVTKYYSET